MPHSLQRLPPRNHWPGTIALASVAALFILVPWGLSTNWWDLAMRWENAFFIRRKNLQPSLQIFGGPPRVENYKYATLIKDALKGLDAPYPERRSVDSASTRYSTGLDDNLLELITEDKMNGRPAVGFLQDGWMYRQPQAALRYDTRDQGVILPDDVGKIRAVAPMFVSLMHVFVSNAFVEKILAGGRARKGRRGGPPSQESAPQLDLGEILNRHEAHRFYFGGTGTGSRLMCANVILPAYGFHIDDFPADEDVAGPMGNANLSIDKAIDAMKAPQPDIDVAFILVGKEIDSLEDPRILDNYQLVGISRSDAIASANRFVTAGDIEPGTYRYPKEVPGAKLRTVGTTLVLAANSRVSDVQAYSIASAILQSTACRSRFDLLLHVNQTNPDSSFGYPLLEGAKAAFMGNGPPTPSWFPSWIWPLVLSIAAGLFSVAYARIRRARVTSLFVTHGLANESHHLIGTGRAHSARVNRAYLELLILMSRSKIRRDEYDWARTALERLTKHDGG